MSMQLNPDDKGLTKGEIGKNAQRPCGGNMVYHKVHIGPLPPAEEIEKYEQIFPGAAKVILTTFRRQALHRMKMEEMEMQSQVESRKLQDRLTQTTIEEKNEYNKNSLNMGCVAIFVMIGIAATLAFYGREGAAALFMAAPVLKVLVDKFRPQKVDI